MSFFDSYLRISFLMDKSPSETIVVLCFGSDSNYLINKKLKERRQEIAKYNLKCYRNVFVSYCICYVSPNNFSTFGSLTTLFELRQTQKNNVNNGRLQKVMNHIFNSVLLSTEHI